MTTSSQPATTAAEGFSLLKSRGVHVASKVVQFTGIMLPTHCWLVCLICSVHMHHDGQLVHTVLL